MYFHPLTPLNLHHAKVEVDEVTLDSSRDLLGGGVIRLQHTTF